VLDRHFHAACILRRRIAKRRFRVMHTFEPLADS
jgi:hypothetical protein